MVVIRLCRAGKKGAPIYKVNVQDSNAAPGGRFIEKLGNYVPSASKSSFVIDQERFNYWVKLGAQPSDRVKKLIKTYPVSAT
jgi:small subunit ribosomal protein S16